MKQRAWLGLSLVMIALAGCNKSKAEQDDTTQPEIAAVDQRDLDVTADASGLVEPIQTVEKCRRSRSRPDRKCRRACCSCRSNRAM